jgi:hypothetical protein
MNQNKENAKNNTLVINKNVSQKSSSDKFWDVMGNSKFDNFTAEDFTTELGKIPDFIKQSASDFKNYGYSSSDDVYKGIVSGVDNYKRTIENAKKYNPEWYEKNKVDVDNVVKALDDVYNSYAQKRDVYKQFSTEQDFNDAVKYNFYSTAADIDHAINDVKSQKAAIQSELDTINANKKTGLVAGSIWESQNGAKINELEKKLQQLDEKEASFTNAKSELKRNQNLRDRYNKKLSFGGVQNVPEFAEYSEKGSKDYTVDVSGSIYDIAQSYNSERNKDGFNNQNKLALFWAITDKYPELLKDGVSIYDIEGVRFGGGEHLDYFITQLKSGMTVGLKDEQGNITESVDIQVSQMDDTQRKIYNYLFAMNGAEVANEYLAVSGEELSKRKGEAEVEALEGKPLKQIWYGFTQAPKQWEHDFLQSMSGLNAQYPVSHPSVYGSQKIKEDETLGGFGRFVFDVAQTLGYQLPAQVVSSLVGGFAGDKASAITNGLMMGMGAAGGAYTEAVNMGYDTDQARSYAIMVGAAETALESLSDGATKAGGLITGNALKKATSGIKSGIGKFAVKLPGKMLSEATEEYLAEVLDTAWKNIAFDRADDLEWLSGDAFYAALLGAVSAVGMGSISSVSDIRFETARDQIIDAGLSLAHDTEAYKLASSLESKKYKLEPKQLQDLSNKIQETTAKMYEAKIEQNRKWYKQIRNELVSLGETGDVSAIASAIVRLKNNDAITVNDLKLIADSKLAADYGFNPSENTISQTEDTQNEVDSVLPQVSAAAPEADSIKDWAFKERGLERLTDDQRLLKSIGKALGREIKFGDLDRWVTTKKGKRRKQRINGFYDRSTGTIYLNTKSSANALITVFKHELTHFAESDPAAYTDFANGLMDSKAFKDWVASKGFKTEGDVSATLAMNADYRDRYGNSGLKGTEVFNDPVKGEHAANLEMVADFVAENLFSGDMSKLQEALSNVEPEAVNKFKQFLLNILNKIKNLFKKKVGGFETIQGIEAEFVKVCDAAQKAWEQKTADNKKSTDEGGKQYSVFTANVDVLDLVQKVKDGNFKANEKVYFDDVSDGLASKIESLTGINVKGFKVAIEARQIEHILKDHGENGKSDHSMSSDEDIAKMEYVLKNPDDLSLSGKTQAYSYMKNGYNKTADTVLYEKAIGDKSYYVVQAIPDTKAKTLYVVSAFIGEKGYKKETSQLINAKSPDATAKSGSVVVSNNSIDQNEPSVNSNSKQESKKYSLPTQTDSDGRQLSEGQQEYFKDSKVRDDNGNLKVMYQGAQSEFYKFDRKKSSPYNLYGRGFYFTDSKSHANQYGTAREYYLNIKNPVPTSKIDSIITREQMRKYLEVVAENEDDYDIWNYGTTDIDVILDKVFDGRSDFAMLQDVNATAIGDLVAAIELFNEVNGTSFDGIDLATETVTFNSEQAKLTSNAVPTTDPDIRYSLPDSRSDLLQRFKDGEITEEEFAEAWDNKPSKENPISIANLKPEDANTTPKKKRKKGENKGNKESNLYESIQTSDIFNDSFKKTAKDDSYIKTYQSITNKKTLNKAFKELEEGGQQYVNKWFNKPVDEASLVDITVGLILMDRYQRIGDYESAMAATERVREMGTASGRQVQIFSIIGRFTPDMMVKYAQKELTKAFELMVDAKTKRWGETHQDIFKLTADEIETIRRKTLQAAIMPDGSRTKAILLAEICTMLQDKIPPDAGTSIRAWQRVSMLLNFKTNIRNIVGNLGMVPIYIASDYWGSVGDWALSKLTGVRTTGVSGVVGNLLTSQGRQHLKKVVKAFGKGIYETYDDFKRGIHTKQEELNRYAIEDFGMVKSDGVFKKKAVIHQGITSGGKSFNDQTQYKLVNAIAKKLNALDNFTSFCLELGDRPFFEMWFMNSLNNQLRLNKTETPTPEMIDIATEEALQRTWQDNNAMTRAVSKIKQAANSLPLHIPLTNYGLGDMLIKFTKTPANLAKAIVDFSPVGLVTAGYKAAQLVKKYKGGSFTPQMQKDVVRTMSNAITGTMFYALVIMGASLGYITFTGDADDDKDVANFEKYIAGVPPYSIEIFGVNVTYDWFQPFGSTLAIAAEFMENQEDPTTGIGEDMWNAFLAAGEVFTQQSFLKSLYEFFSSADENILTGLADLALSDPSTNIPTFLSQVASFFDEDRRSTYDSNSLKNLWNQIRQKLPAVRNQLPEQVNTFGETVENNQYMNFWRAFFSPYNDYPESSGKVADKVYDLYKETGDKSVMPRVAPYKITVKGQAYNFTVEQRNDFQREMGSTSVDMLDKAFKSKEFKQLSDEEKVKVIGKIYGYATKQAKIDFLVSNYDYELLASLSGENDDGDPILTKEMYKKMNSKAKKHIIEDYFLSKNEMGFKTLDDAVDYYITKAKE